MTPYIETEKLNAACQAAADTLGVNINVFKRAIYEDMQAEYDEADIRQWFDDQDYVYSDDDVYAILNILREDYDSNMSCWENIEAAYNNAGLSLLCEGMSDSIHTEDSIDCEDLIVAIETNEDGSRQAHLYAYGYCTGDGAEPAYRFVEYTFFIVPLNEVLQKGIFDVESEYSEFIKQYIHDCTEEEMLELYKHYDDGNCPKPIAADQITADIPDGTYVVQRPEERKA